MGKDTKRESTLGILPEVPPLKKHNKQLRQQLFMSHESLVAKIALSGYWQIILLLLFLLPAIPHSFVGENKGGIELCVKSQ